MHDFGYKVTLHDRATLCLLPVWTAPGQAHTSWAQEEKQWDPRAPSLDAHRLISFAGVCTQVLGKPAGIERGGSADVAAAHPGAQSAAEPAGVSGRLAPTRSCNVGAAAAHGLLAGTQLSLSAELAASAARNGAYLNIT